MQAIMGELMRFSASDEFMAWATSLSGMFTKIRTEYGSVAEMVESPEWDEGRTERALILIKSLHTQLAKIEKELTIHVNQKYGKNDR